MKGLPPVLDKVRMKLKPEDLPPVVIYIPDVGLIPDVEELTSTAVDENIPILGMSHWWLEVAALPTRVGLLIRASEKGDMMIKCYQTAGRWLDSFPFNPYALNDYQRWKGEDLSVQRGRRLLTTELIRVMAYLWKVENTPAEVSIVTGTRNAPAAFHRRGDTLRYDRLESLRTTSGQHRGYTPPEEPSGIRKREHGVRGHWRTYRSGVRIWVREHRRGDPELGRVTRVIS
jgi:hypothetical protein